MRQGLDQIGFVGCQSLALRGLQLCLSNVFSPAASRLLYMFFLFPFGTL
jgi:hypothetical protein